MKMCHTVVPPGLTKQETDVLLFLSTEAFEGRNLWWAAACADILYNRMLFFKAPTSQQLGWHLIWGAHRIQYFCTLSLTRFSRLICVISEASGVSCASLEVLTLTRQRKPSSGLASHCVNSGHTDSADRMECRSNTQHQTLPAAVSFLAV